MTTTNPTTPEPDNAAALAAETLAPDAVEESTPPAEVTETAAAEETPAEPENGRETRGSEAAKYRRQLRETETERDALRGRVEALQQSIVLERAGAAFDFPGARAVKLHHPEDLFTIGGAKPADLINDDGSLDHTALRDAAAALHAARPELFHPTIGPNPAQAAGVTSGVDTEPSRWERAFKPHGD